MRQSQANPKTPKLNTEKEGRNINKQDSDAQRLSEKQTLEVSDLKLIEIDQLWVITNNSSIPKAQIMFLCDFLEINSDKIMEMYHAGQYRVHQFQTHDFYNYFYSNSEQKKLAIETLKQLSNEGSYTASLLMKALQKDRNQEIKFTEKDDDIISSLMHNLCLVVQGNLVDAFYASLKNIMNFGFNHCPHNLPMIPKIGGMQILIGLFDCFGQSHGDFMEDLLRKDLYFGGENLINFVHYYYDPDRKYMINVKSDMQSDINKQRQEDRENKDQLTNILNKIIERLKNMKVSGIRHSIFLYNEMVKFYQKIHNKQTLIDESDNDLVFASEITVKEKDQLYHLTPLDIRKNQEWLAIKSCIINNEILTKKQEQNWINFAFKELYYDSIQMLGEKSIIIDQNTVLGLRCYNLLLLLGEKKSIQILYSLLCYNGLYKDILNLLQPSLQEKHKKPYLAVMVIQCQIRHSKVKESLEELKEIAKSRIEAYDLYLLSKCVFTQEEKDYFGALCVFTIISNISQSQFKLFDNLILAKLLFRGGVFLQKNVLQSYSLLKVLLKHGYYELMRDYLCKLFIKKNLDKVSEQVTKEQKRVAKALVKNSLPPQFTKKAEVYTLQESQGNIIKIKKRKKNQHETEQTDQNLFSKQLYQQLLQLQTRDVKTSILAKIYLFKEKSQMQYITSTLKQHYEDLVHIGYNILFPPGKNYSIGNCISNYDFFKRKNLLKMSIQSAASTPLDVQSLRLLIVKNQNILKATQIFSLEKINYNILKYFYMKKTEEIQREKQLQDQERANRQGQIELEAMQGQNDLQRQYYIRVQKQLEQIEEKSEHSLQYTKNKLSMQSVGEVKVTSHSNQRYPTQSENQLESVNDFQMNSHSKSIVQSSSRFDKKQEQSSQYISIQENDHYLKEGSQSQIQTQQNLQSDQTNNQNNLSKQEDANNISYPKDSKEILPNKKEENILQQYFYMKLDKQYNISLKGKFMQDEILVFTNEDLVFTGENKDSIDNTNEGSRQQNGNSFFNGQNGYGYFKFNTSQKFQITKIPNVEKIFSDDFYPLIKRSSSFCLKYYGFYMNEQVWYVLSETYDEKLTLNSDLTFIEIYQLYQIALALHLNEQFGLINYWGTNILYRKGGKIYLPNIITLIQLYHYDFSISNVVSLDITEINEQIIQKQKHHQNSNQTINRNEYAPEVFVGNMEMQRAKCDIWALGSILFHTIFKKPLINLVNNSDYIQELAKLKNPYYLSTILNKEKEEYLQKSNQSSYQNLENSEASITKIKIPPDILDIYLKIIQMSIVYDSEIRSSSEEIASFLLQQLKLNTKIAAGIDNYEKLLEYSDNLVLDISSEIEKCQREGTNESIFITGSNTFVWVNYKDCIVYYRDSYKNSYILHNPELNITHFSLKDVIKGEGILINPSNDIILGYFSSNCVPQNIEVIDTISGNPYSQISYDERGAPINSSIESLLEKDVITQIKNVKQQQQEQMEGAFLKRIEESKSLNYLALIQQFLTYWKSQKKMYEDLFGNKVTGFFDNDQGTICAADNIPIVIQNSKQKTIYILNDTCVVLDHSVFSIQFFHPLELFNSQDKTIGNYLNEIFCKDQPYNTTFMLSGLCFVGNFRCSRFEDGFLIFKKTNSLTIKYHPDPTVPYFTKINYNSQHFYEGYIHQGMYNGIGEYSNKKQVLYRGNFENNFLTHGQIFFDGHPTYLSYEGEVIYDLETQTYVMHGQGRCILKNKSVFEGQFDRNEFNGKGKLTYNKNKGVYEGFFRNGIREGPGVFKSKKIQFQGEYRKGLKYNYGKQVRKNGKEIYEGEFRNDKRNGVGVLRYPFSSDIIFYQGEFFDDKKHGHGIEITRSKQKFLVKYYKDQRIRRKQVRLDTEECLFHFQNEEQQKQIDKEYIKSLEMQGSKDQNQDYPIQYYTEVNDQVGIQEQEQDFVEQIEKVNAISPIARIQNDTPEHIATFELEQKPQNPTQNPQKIYSIF
ncbi:MORN motif protein (macronuclear) [Tetrahymena thermophila SB210]|uniref:MORN motif protein n=1 Tax=Tetrahymena thermophila (strain SB210) TaxID=312017 RepID=I7LWN9_TETTS|nr:MORN motif protein [Tetrahymena thermophila SB210]EAS02439.2 MORN motif protein [Tetrahymena thermophila SB210]|eukprot:XP_001022684.2 MORN motif protein [Tetrahymena thermophila SB210]